MSNRIGHDIHFKLHVSSSYENVEEKGTSIMIELAYTNFIVFVPKPNSCPQASSWSVDFAHSLDIIHGHNSHH